MKKEILIPQEWEDVTLGEFIELSLLDINSFASPIEYYIKMLEVFGNDLTDIVDFIKFGDITSIINQMSFLNTPPEHKDIKEVTINKVTYKLIENMNDLSVGEYITMETLIERDKLNSITAIPTILSVILRPVGEEFDSNKCNERMELFKKELSIEQVLKMSVFFSTGVR
tara:strand:+ start:4059 stop:4568 length:510 start_codon:yes stop_codon:yes gene_type:complete